MTNGENHFRSFSQKNLFPRKRAANVLSLIFSNLLLILMLSGCGGSGNRLLAGQELATDQHLQSANGFYTLTLQNDGNLVLRDINSQALWSTDTHGTAATRLILQMDGNLVLYTDSDNPVWASNTVGSGASELRLNDNGSLVLYQGTKSVWS
ncbi:MAG: hypothetical protein R3208_14425, partial [Ketobacteraceae bacterium]|nr:hypothetical protein [Ketobacteraceae bacterium]